MLRKSSGKLLASPQRASDPTNAQIALICVLRQSAAGAVSRGKASAQQLYAAPRAPGLLTRRWHVAWLRYQQRPYPGLALVHAVPNPARPITRPLNERQVPTARGSRWHARTLQTCSRVCRNLKQRAEGLFISGNLETSSPSVRIERWCRYATPTQR